jgi:transposase-like protein
LAALNNRKWTDEEKATALQLYQEVGPAETARRTGIPRSSVSVWAHNAGLTVITQGKTAAAVLMSRETFEARRLLLSQKFQQAADDYLTWAHEQTIDYVGQQGREVTRKRPIAGDVRNLTLAAAIAVDKADMLSKPPSTTTTTEVTTFRDEFSSVRERSIFRRIVDMAATLPDGGEGGWVEADTGDTVGSAGA